MNRKHAKVWWCTATTRLTTDNGESVHDGLAAGVNNNNWMPELGKVWGFLYPPSSSSSSSAGEEDSPHHLRGTHLLLFFCAIVRALLNMKGPAKKKMKTRPHNKHRQILTRRIVRRVLAEQVIVQQRLGERIFRASIFRNNPSIIIYLGNSMKTRCVTISRCCWILSRWSFFCQTPLDPLSRRKSFAHKKNKKIIWSLGQGWCSA